ncbi:hypothetical protein RND71_009756 [Anisodus tanguticus]|uniref:Uncharacterized protein n=1 Tax=Anisodus tanguticus TaxID=243964 RepID=A0AAE1SKA5_9SOLA|nr:hypothetical protein RND71_009756 [Anisodus tanguticus]
MGLSPKCVYFKLDGAVEFDNLLNGYVCKTTKQGHFSIVVEFITAEPEPASGGVSGSGTDGHKSGKKKWVIFGSVVGGFVAVALVSLVLLITCLKKYDKQKKIDRMEEAADRDVEFGDVIDGKTRIQGHFSIVAEVKVAPSPSPVLSISGILIVLVRKFGFLEIRQRLDDSVVIVEPLLGNTEVPLPVEAPIRPLLENDYVLQVTQKL